MNIIDDLKWRGSINQTTDETGLTHLLQQKKISLYVGVDPTAQSIHIGNLIPLTILKRFQNDGHRPVIVIGGGTGMIGDPSGKAAERQLLPPDVFDENVKRITKQLTRLFGKDGFEIVNNYDWLSKLNLISFLRDFGKLFPINVMLKRDVVASRLEAGISFTEFTYQILQAIDFYTLFNEKNVQLQVGGGDQYGNISSGVELIHKLLGPQAQAFGLTVPLLLKSDGTKFGKSAGGAIWLDPEFLSPYEFYQFFYNQADDDVIKLLKIFTFLSHEEIENLAEKVRIEPGKREAQTRLAQEVTKFVHGQAAVDEAEKISQILFSGDVQQLTSTQVAAAFSAVPSIKITTEKIAVVDLLSQDDLIEKSKRQAREDLKNGAITVNGQKVTEVEKIIDPADKFDGKFVIIRRGKKKYFLAKVQ
ncbi:tyrosine--tRNA ligase [Oenococcus sicerae]|uniref:Tyrosine--tRNA ligase n=1 Tax=Oenococcus sicerae TaxID=2203724 RepID=A0AAJ1RBU1_9LACO|nr:tyrosine--tRNA ligase [Oenococcus sicerae]MDN6900015.1 tyrosine--tRNA ligase [Oenococcus sicerae]QAS69625.1 tyrosine--tRNA ligase [Oenococcus sicerae]